MKKILVLINDSSWTYNLRKELLEKLLKEGNEVIISCPIGEYTEELKKMGCEFIDISLSRHSKNIIKDFKLFINYIRTIKFIKPDIVLTFTIKPNIYGGIACRLLKIPYLVNITGLGTALENKSIIQNILIYLYRIALKNVICIFFQNEDNRSFFLKRGFNFKNSKLIPGSGVNLEKFKHEILLKNKKVKFLFIGRVMRDKGIEEYLEVAKRISKKYLNVEFEILGQFEEESYKEIIKKYQENKFIKYLGTSKDVREQIKKVHCLINPSWHEGMSNVLLEAGAMKKFLIASEISGCKEIVLNERTGFTFERKNIDELEKKVDDFINLPENKYKEYIDKSYEHIKNNFSRKIVVDEYLKVINKIYKMGELL